MRLIVPTVFIVITAGCGVDLQVPNTARIECKSNSECPPDWRCITEIGECVLNNASGTIKFENVTLSADVLGPQDTLTVEFDVTARLRLDAEVVVATTPASLLSRIDDEDDLHYVYRISAADLSEGLFDLEASAIGLDGSVAQSVDIGRIAVDFTNPELAGAIVATPAVVGLGQIVNFAIAVNEPLRDPPELTLGWPDLERTTTFVEASGTTDFTFSYVATGDEPTASANALVTMVDLAGNESIDAQPGVVRVDARGPQPIPDVVQVSIFPGESANRGVVDSLTHGNRLEVVVAFDEPVVDDPDGEEYPQALLVGGPSLILLREIGTTSVFELVPQTLPTNGTYDIEVTARDAVGNVSSVVLSDVLPDAGRDASDGRVVVDGEAPAPAVLSGIVHVREPWGVDGGIPNNRLEGAVGSAEACAAGSMVCPEIVFYDHPDLLVEVGRASIGVDGDFVASLGARDYPEVRAVVIDTAGNSSSGSRVRFGRWAASLAGKRPRNFVGNPHAVYQRLESDLGPQANPIFTREIEEYASLEQMDDSYASVSGLSFWRELATSSTGPEARSSAAMAYDSRRGEVLMFGGIKIVSGGYAFDFSDFWKFTETGWQEIVTFGGPLKRHGHLMAYDPRRGVTVVFGGDTDSETGPGIAYQETWEWNGEVWSRRCDGQPANDICAQIPEGGDDLAAMAYDENLGKILFVDSHTEPCGTWTFGEEGWEKLNLNPATAPTQRDGAAMAFDHANGVMILYGGGSGDEQQETWSWNGSSWIKLNPSANAGAQRSHVMGYDGDRGVIVLAGSGDTYEWNGSTWSNPNQELASYDSMAGVYSGLHREMILFGGFPNGVGNYTDITESWNGSRWQQRYPVLTTAPGASTVIYDQMGDQLLALSAGVTKVFDGFGWTAPTGSHPAGDTTQVRATYDEGRQQAWAYDSNARQLWYWRTDPACGGSGRCWTTTSSSTAAPSARSNGALAYDSDRDALIFFGGGTNSAPLGDTWEYRAWGTRTCGGAGRCWADTGQNGPVARRSTAMAYDPNLAVTVLFGGRRAGGGTADYGLNDTWYWNGSSWTGPIPSAHSPVARYQHAMTYDTARGRVAVFGGTNAAGFGITVEDAGLWEWTGATWVELVAAADRTAPSTLSMTYDNNAGRLISSPAGGLSIAEWKSAGGRATAWVQWNWFAANVPPTSITQATIAIAGTSDAGPPGADEPAGGFDLFLWNATTGGWDALGSGAGSATSMVAIPLNADDMAGYLGDQGSIDLRTTTEYRSGPFSGAMLLDYAQIDLEYDLGP